MGTRIQFPRAPTIPDQDIHLYQRNRNDARDENTSCEVIKVPDNNHMSLEWYETRGGQEKKTMEIAYTRAGKK